MTDLVTRLRALSRAEHDDLSVGAEAADEIERLRAALARIGLEAIALDAPAGKILLELMVDIARNALTRGLAGKS